MGLLNTNNFFGIKGSFDELKWLTRALNGEIGSDGMKTSGNKLSDHY